MNVSLIASPYHLGHRDVGMGAGPTAFLNGGAAHTLRQAGHDASVTTVEPSRHGDHEIAAVFAVNRALASAVRDAVRQPAFPVLLAGNCNSCLGTIAGLGLAKTACVWFDAHGDYHSPDTTESGFFDGMALHIATGGSWRSMAGALEGFRPMAPRDVILAGVRDLDEREEEALDDSSVRVCHYRSVRETGVRQTLTPALDALSGRIRDLYLHVDLDVLDPTEAPVNGFQPEGGLAVQELLDVLDLIGDRFQVRAAALTGYDPACDPRERGLAAGLEVLKALGGIGWGP